MHTCAQCGHQFEADDVPATCPACGNPFRQHPDPEALQREAPVRPGTAARARQLPTYDELVTMLASLDAYVDRVAATLGALAKRVTALEGGGAGDGDGGERGDNLPPLAAVELLHLTNEGFGRYLEPASDLSDAAIGAPGSDLRQSKVDELVELGLVTDDPENPKAADA